MSRVYLPEGAWLDWWSDEEFEGRRWVERPVVLETLPLDVRAGAIYPLEPARQVLVPSVNGPVPLRIRPGANGASALDDEGTRLVCHNGLRRCQTRADDCGGPADEEMAGRDADVRGRGQGRKGEQTITINSRPVRMRI